jgi:hypothetical protein
VEFGSRLGHNTNHALPQGCADSHTQNTKKEMGRFSKTVDERAEDEVRRVLAPVLARQELNQQVEMFIGRWKLDLSSDADPSLETFKDFILTKVKIRNTHEKACKSACLTLINQHESKLRNKSKKKQERRESSCIIC